MVIKSLSAGYRAQARMHAHTHIHTHTLWGQMEIIYLPLHCHHQNDSCIKMGSDESHFNVLSLIVRVKVTGQVSTDHNLSEESGEPKRNQAQALLLTSPTPHRWARPCKL